MNTCHIIIIPNCKCTKAPDSTDDNQTKGKPRKISESKSKKKVPRDLPTDSCQGLSDYRRDENIGGGVTPPHPPPLGTSLGQSTLV